MIHFLSHLLFQLGLLLLFLFSVYGFGSTVLATFHLPFTNAVERWLFAQATGFGLVSIIMLGLGGLALYDPRVAWALVVFGLVLGLREVTTLSARPWKTLRWQVPSNPVVFAGLSLIVLAALGYTLLANGLIPPISYDVIAYHFAIPKIYIDAHRIVYIPYIVYSNWPLATEMLYALGLLLGSEFLSQLVTWSFAALIAVGLIAFAQKRLLPWTGLLAAALFFSMPMVAAIAGTGFVEVPLTCFSFLAFYAFWRWREEKTSDKWLLLSALMSGFSASTKLNGAGTAIVIASMAIIFEALDRRVMHGVKMFISYGLASFLVVAPWYLKSWLFTGDPLWPFLQPVLATRDWDIVGTEYLLTYIRSTNMLPTLQNWLLGMWYVATDQGRFGSFLMGPYLLILMPLIILPALFVRNIRPLIGALGLMTLGLYSIWFLLTHQTRFLMPATPAMSLLAAAGVAWLWQLPFRLGRWTSQAAVLVWLIAGAWIFTPEIRADWALRWPYLRGAETREAYLTSVYEDYPVFQYVNEMLAPNVRIALLPQDVRGYYLNRPYVWANPISQRFLPLDQYQDPSALNDALRRLGVTHVFVNSKYLISSFRYADHDNHLVAGLVETYGRLVFERGSSQLYELR